MICLICRQAEITDGLASVQFERGEMRLVVNSVPASICPSCGDACVDEEVAVRLLREGERISKARASEGVLEYDEL